VWLEFGTEEKKPPEQLPIVLQVLLSQQHRLRALVLLGKFLDLGYWAVNQALSVGIFPYVLKLLQSPAVELREILVFIWAKILALDKSCQLDLIKDGGQHYFINVLGNTKVPAPQRTQAAFILSVISNNCRPGQQACLNARMLQICLGQLNEQDSMLRRWVVFALAKFWENYEEAKWAAIKDGAHEKLCSLLQDPVPEVRAAAVYALGTFIGGGHSPEPLSAQQPSQPGQPQGPSVQSQPSNPSAPGNAPQTISSHRTSGGASSQPAFGSASRARSEQRTSIELNLAVTLPVVTTDSSPMVRKELIIAFAHLIQAYEDEFKTLIKAIQRKEQAKVALDKKKEADKKKVKPGPVKGAPNQPPSPEAEELPNANAEQSSIYEFVWDHLWNLTTDPYPELARIAIALVNKVKTQAGDTSLLPMPPVEAPRRMSEDLQASPAGKSPRPGAKKIQHKKVPSFSNLLLLKKQPSMNDLRSSGGIPATPSTPKTASLHHHDDDSRDDDNDNSAEDLRSTLYEWSCNYFSLPLMTTKEEDETSPQYSEKRWRQQRIEHLKKEALSLNDKAFQILGCRKLENEIAILENDNEMVSLLAFHPFENIIVVGDEKDGISVWNWEEGGKINLFSNCNPPGTRLTALSLLNEHDYPLIATGSDDGVVRIWSGIYEPESVKLVTAWRVLLGLAPLTKGTGAGLIVDWQQQNELMIASGNVGSIRIWDVNKELKIQDISTACEAFVTALASDKSGGSVIAAGCADGSVRLFDRRTSSKFGPVATFSEHKGWIVSVSMPKSINQIISGSTSGEIKFWDPAKSSSVRTITAHSGTVMTSCTVHDQAPLIATGSQDQRIKVMNFNSEELSLIRYHDGFLGQRIGPVSSLSFHPFQILLAAGATDSIVSIYAGETFKTTPSP
jgi:regulator-associated protein of mTOR